MSNDDIVIEVKNVSKRYAPIGYQPSLRHEAVQLAKRGLGLTSRADWEREAFWALKNISFSVPRGQGLGVIGRNGAGKTTLLRMLSDIIVPTEGEIHVRGRFTTLIGLGTGFDQQRTGLENIYLNAAIFGVRPKQVDEFLDEIVAFSELEEFLHQPVKYYSSGMKARLGFSVAIHILPDIIFLDEILSVGDEAFKKKCLDKMMEFKENNCTFLFVSHSAGQVQRICERSIWLHKGELIMEDETPKVLKAYRNRFNPGANANTDDDE